VLAIVHSTCACVLCVWCIVQRGRLPIMELSWRLVIVVTVLVSVFFTKYFVVRKQTPRKHRCSFALFKKLASDRSDGYIDGRGNWTRVNGSVVQPFHNFACQQTHGMRLPTGQLEACLRQEKNDFKFRHIVFVGDSNAHKYMRAFRELVMGEENGNSFTSSDVAGVKGSHVNSSFACSDAKIHSNLSYNSYNSPEVLVKRRCRSGGMCTFQAKQTNRNIEQAKCWSVHKRKYRIEMVIEYIPMFYWQMSDREVVSYIRAF